MTKEAELPSREIKMSKGRKRVIWLTTMTCLFFIGMGIEVSHLGLFSAAHSLENQVELARKEGLPLEPQDLARPVVPVDENAGFALVSAYDSVEHLPGDPVNVLAGFEEKPPTDVQLRNAISQLKPAFDVIHEVYLRPHFDLHLKIELGIGLSLNEVTAVRRLCRSLTKRAEFEAKHSLRNQALQTLLEASNLCRMLNEEPFIHGISSRLGLETRVLNEVENLMRPSSSDAAALYECQRILDSVGPIPDLKRAEKEDLVWQRVILRQIPNWEATHPRSGPSSDGMNEESLLLRFKSVFDLNESTLISEQQSIIKALPSKPSELLRARSALEKFNSDDDSSTSLDIPEQAKVRLSHLLPSYHIGVSTLNAWGRCIVRRRLIAKSLQILQQRTRTGRIPESLPISKLDTIDVFTGNPLRYRRTNSSFVLYSVGEDGTDEGGRPYPLDDDPHHRCDVSFEFPTLSVKPKTK